MIKLYVKNSCKNIIIADLSQHEAQYGCLIANTYDCEDAKKLLDGFNIISFDHRHIFPYQIKPYKNGKLIKEPWVEHMPQKVFDTLEKNLGWHLLIKAKKFSK